MKKFTLLTVILWAFFANRTLGQTCTNNLLTNPNFEAQNISGWAGSGIYAENQINGRYLSVCTNTTAANQTKTATAGKTYTLNVRAFKSFADTKGVIGLKFMSSSFVPLLQEYLGVTTTTHTTLTISKIAPAGTAYVEVSAIKDTGSGCINTDDWCLTDVATGGGTCSPDVTAPVLTACPGAINQTTQGTTAIVNWTPPIATDNCAGTVTVTSNRQVGSAFPIGNTVVVYTATDAAGNSSICTFPVSIAQQAGGTCVGNLLLNPSFEDDLMNWNTSGTLTGVSTSVNFLDLRQTGILVYQTVASQAGKSYTLEALASRQQTEEGIISIKFLNSSFTPLTTDFLPIVSTGAFAFLTKTVTSPANTAWIEVSILKTNGTFNNSIYVDDMCLREGTVAPKPDFMLTNLSFPVPAAPLGGILKAKFDIKNIGLGAFSGNLKINATSSFSEAPPFILDSIQLNNISIGAQSVLTGVELNIHIPPNAAANLLHSFSFFVDSNNQIAETDEGNNFAGSEFCYFGSVDNYLKLCKSPIGNGTIVCGEALSNGAIDLVVDSSGYWLRKTINSTGKWSGTALISKAASDSTLLQGNNLVYKNLNGVTIETIALAASVTTQFNTANKFLARAQRDQNGQYWVLGVKRNLIPVSNLVSDTLFILKVNAQGGLISQARIDTIFGLQTRYFGIIAIPNGSAEVYYATKNSNSVATRTTLNSGLLVLNKAVVSSYNSSFILQAPSFPSFSYKKSPCDAQAYIFSTVNVSSNPTFSYMSTRKYTSSGVQVLPGILTGTRLGYYDNRLDFSKVLPNESYSLNSQDVSYDRSTRRDVFVQGITLKDAAGNVIFNKASTVTGLRDMYRLGVTDFLFLRDNEVWTTVCGTPVTTNSPDLSLSIVSSPQSPGQWKNATITVTLQNTGTVAATNVTAQLPAQSDIAFWSLLAYQSHIAPTGTTFNSWTGLWTVGVVVPGQTVTLTYNGFTKVAGQIPFFAQVQTASPTDTDSAPGNNTTGNPTEDDEARTIINVNLLAPGDRNQVGVQNQLNVEQIADYQLFPNPAGESFFVKTPNNQGDTKMILLNQMGIIEKTQEFSPTLGANNETAIIQEFPLKEVSNGVYFVKIETAGQRTVVRKLVVSRMY
jgi:hypothetical protein